MFHNKYSILRLAILLICSNVGLAQERLTSRFTYFSNDPQCNLSPGFPLQNKLIASNKAVLNYTINKQMYYQYKPSFKGLGGNAEIFVYKYRGIKNLDNRVMVEVGHNNTTDTLFVDFTTQKDTWTSIGKFQFNGDGNEFVRFSRLYETDSNIITPVLPVRFDLYYNTHTRPVTKSDINIVSSIGLFKKGNWNQYKNSDYQSRFNSYFSISKGDIAVWNPGLLMSGKLNIYLYKPFTASKDVYTVSHNGKIDKLKLSNLLFANLDLFNPVTAQGWYKLGEFDFNGNGNEYIKVEKTGNDTTLANCVMFEKVNLDGTLLDRIIVAPIEYTGNYIKEKESISLEEKIKSTKKTVGLSPNNNGESIVTSSKNGSTIYSRAIYSKEKSPNFTWNPCITESGDYDLYYFVYYMPNNNGTFLINSNGTIKSTPVFLNQLKAQQQYKVGTYKFLGGRKDEFIEMTNFNRASDITLEKIKANGAIIKQVVVTAHPYFAEYIYQDTKDIPERHNISEMFRKGFVKPLGPQKFGINERMSLNEFKSILKKVLDSANVTYIENSICYNINTRSNIEKGITLDIASQVLFNAMELSGRYSNVRNYFKSTSDQILAKYKDAGTIKNKEAVAKLLEMKVVKPYSKSTLHANSNLSRLEAILLLKEFNEQILCSGPPSLADWDISFGDEFEGDTIDWNKWFADDAVRFKGISAKWKENCVVEDGLFKGYNYMDNHVVPYSSGNLYSNFRQTYGFFEARYKYPDKAYGSHSSFWTSSKGGDFNYNEGAYPNSVSNNNYFMKSGTNFHDFSTASNLAHDFHTISGYLNSKDLFYGMDGKITWEVKDYPKFYSDVIDSNTGLGKSTNFPYNAMISTVVTYFDGPLDRDRIDGSYMACDWVRLYKEITWLPKVDTIVALVNGDQKEWVVKFNKPMDIATIKDAISINTSTQSAVNYKVTTINSMRYKISLIKPFPSNFTYQLFIKKNAKDTRGNALGADVSYKLRKQ